MKIIQGLAELKTLVGQELGTSDWLTIPQTQINAFAEATGDHQWIHTQPEMAKQYSPFKTTIAHGFLTLSLLPMLMDKIWQVQGVKMGINYGTNKVRFPAPVPVDSQIRLKAVLSSLDELDANSVQTMVTATFEREGGEKPVCVAEFLMRFYF
ncbi:MAG: MaoC family dehydratase [Bacteroidetes bacterium]|nr:MAG: MaoC family dehydratase [Bacteroidota bacterium]